MIYLLFFVLLFPVISFADIETTKHRHSFSVQVGLNGAMNNKNSFGLQVFPPDLSYSYKFFDNNKYMFSTSSFYDNIGVKINDVNFNYRIGQRFDAGYEMKDTLIYGTFGLGYMAMQGTRNGISPIYGFGIARDVSNKWAVMSELNFQDIKFQTIINLSVGVIYSFDL